MASEPRDAHVPGILRLSPAIRHRIYLEIPMGRWEQYDNINHHVYNLGDQYEVRAPNTGFQLMSEERPRRFFHGLLVSCRTIYTEASALLYSSHWFHFRHKAAHSFAPLRALRPASIASLANLSVILNECSCHVIDDGARCCDDKRNHWYCENVHRHEKNLHDASLRSSNPSAKAMLTEWQATAAYLAAHATPGQLELSLVCDVDVAEPELANQVVDTLQAFPRLKECHVRLSRTPNSRLGELARDAVLRARGILPSGQPSDASAPPQPFPLLSLPVELRLRILEYTDLITPLKEVMWTRAYGRYLATRPYCPSWEGRGDHDSEPDVHHGCQFDSCSMRPWPKQSIGCFCRRDHSTFSSTCRCWAPPIPLFLVCRLLREDANRVFFSSNRFVVIDGPTMFLFGPPHPGEYESNRLAASQFLRDVVPAGCHRHLRSLELVFPPWSPGSWPRDQKHPTLQDWSDTVDWVKDKINRPALTMRVTAKFNDDEGGTGDPFEVTDDEAEEIRAVYLGIILQPLARLGGIDGLGGFSADLTWPWRRHFSALSPHILEERIRADEIMRASERSLNQLAEKLVLGGPDGRRPVLDTRPPLKRGAWEPVYARDC